MKLFFRLFWLICFGEKNTLHDVAAKAVYRARVLPTDLDLFGHMNNGRYLMLMDLARIDFARKVGLFDLVVRHRWILPVGSSVLDFQRPLKLGQPFTIDTTLVTWDAKWMYLRQELREVGAAGRVVGCGYVKVVIKGAQGTVAPDNVIEQILGKRVPRPQPEPALMARFGGGSIKAAAPASPAPAAKPADVTPLPAATTAPTFDPESREPIAIVGVGCRLPGGVTDAASFWQMLRDETDCIVDIPNSRWNTKRFFDRDKNASGRMYVQRAGMLQEDLTAFDPGFFGISPREAEIMDPQQRLLLETTWEAFEDAGIPSEQFSGSDTGVYVGGFTMDNMLIQSSPFNRKQLSSVSVTSSTLTMLSNRLSFTFDLRGPSMTIDTACSSSLVGLHQACRGLWHGESTQAVVAGVNVMINPEMQINMTKGQFLSPNARCNTFGDGADGYTRAEGAVSLILKPLSQAQADQNPIYAVIRGSAVNQDGRTNGITNPSREAQIAVMQRAYREAGVAPAEVAYVEAHGTGTAAGDPVEAGAIGAVMRVGRDPNRPLLVASVKTNLGHTEAASGVTGVLKAALCLKQGQVPAHLHLQGVNPDIDMAALQLQVPQTMTPLVAGKQGLIAGVNSFGYGGTNAHVVLAAPPAPAPVVSAQRVAEQPYLLPLSARSSGALRDLAGAYADRLQDQQVSLHDLCYSAAVHRGHHRYRLVAQGDNRDLLRNELRKFAADGAGSAALAFEPQVPDESRLVFVFTGMGPQWWGMGRELYQSQTLFRQTVDECDAVFQAIAGWSIRDQMLAEEAASRMARTEVAQPANAVLQIALTRLWAGWGIHADAMVGHSVGEVPAAYLAGALTLEDAMRVSYHRSRLQQQTAGQGGMLAVGLSPDEALDWVQNAGAGIAVAAVNSDQSVTLAGDLAMLQAVDARLQEAGRFSRFLKVEVPYHSPMMDPLAAGIHESLAGLRPTVPTLPLYSTVTGTRVTDEAHDAAYWWRNVRATVSFGDAMAKLLADGYRCFVEIGPHPVLATSMRQCFQKAECQGATVASLNRKKGEWATMTAGLAKLYCLGAQPDWRAFSGPGRYVPLPRYPWQKQRLWRETEQSARYRLLPSRHPLLGIQGTGPGFTWQTELSLEEMPYLADHVVSDAVLFPGAGFLEMALAAQVLARGETALALERVQFLNACSIKSGQVPTLHLDCEPQSGRVNIYQQRDDESEWQLCATARCFAAGKLPAAVALAALQQRLGEVQPGAVLYRELAARSLDYGPRFQAVQQFQRGDHEVLAEIHLHEADSPAGYHLHPCLLDACFHSLIATVDAGSDAGNVLPVAVERYRFFATPPRRLFAHGRVVPAGAATIYGHIQLMNEVGTVFAEVVGLTCKLLPNPHHKSIARKISGWRYTRVWRERESPATAAAAFRLILLGGDVPQSALSLPRFNKAAAFDSPGYLVAPACPIEDLLASLPAGPPLVVLDGRAPTRAGDDPVARGIDAADRLLQTVQAVPKDSVSRYFLITRDAEAVVDDDRVGNLAAAPLLGLARTLMSERPDLKLTVLDLPHAAGPQPLVTDQLVALLAAAGPDQELAWRENRWWVCRLERAEVSEPNEPDADWLPAAPGSPFMLQQSEKGKLESMRYVRCESETPGPNQVQVDVVAVALGFKDVMKGLGILSDQTMRDTFYGDSLGMESTGVVVGLGDGVNDLAVGDRVVCLYPGSFRSQLCLNRDAVAKIPDNLDFAEGANLIAFLTVWYGLLEIARLRKGERILIHGATGGVGLAAVEVARMVGAEIYATAGSPEKRDYLSNTLGLPYVAHSRTIDFVDEIRAWTGGEGVDVVLNYTPGEIMVKSLHLLQPMGRFIEIGKTSFEDGTALSLHPFMENLLYASVDFDRLMVAKPALIRRMYAELTAAFAEGRIKPSPNTLFPARETEDAFRFMARGRHIGKVVVEMRDAAVPVYEPRAAQRFKQDRTYLITGGLGGFGLQVARWAVDQGACHLALVSRRGAASPEAQAFLAETAQRCLNVQAFSCDVADGAAVHRLIAEVKDNMPALGGVIHGAMVLDDRAYEQLDRASIEKVMGPKALGAWHLHQALQKTELDFMVFFSSISSVLGNAGQGNYVAANAFLDQLAHYRRGLGLPALSINWGVFEEVGVVSRNQGVADHLRRLGITPFSTDEALAALGASLDRDMGQVGLFDVQWSTWAERMVPGSGEQRLAALVSESGGASADEDGKLQHLKTRFGALTEEARELLVIETLKDIVAKVLRVSRDELDADLPLLELGSDSIMSMEIVTLAETELAIEVSAMDVVSGPPIRGLAATWTAQINSTLAAAEPVTAGSTATQPA